MKPGRSEEEEQDSNFQYIAYDEQLREQDRLPKDASNVASYADLVENWTIWVQEAEYFVCKIPDEDDAYVLFCLNWNDNWGRWGWEGCAAVRSAPNRRSKTYVR